MINYSPEDPKLPKEKTKNYLLGLKRDRGSKIEEMQKVGGGTS